MAENTGKQIILPLVIAAALALGWLLGSSYGKTSLNGNAQSDKLVEVLRLIEKNYVDAAPSPELIETTVQQLLSKLDPHSVYISATDRIEASEDLRGNYDGIGVEFNIFNDTLTVITPLSGGPSEAAGIQSGDKIIRVEDENIAGVGLTSAKVYKLLKGPRGTKVDIVILRRKQELEYTITRNQIPQFSIDASYMVKDDIGYVKISRFASTTHQEFVEALEKLKGLGMKRLVLDLQSNPGGYLDEAISLADEFLPSGKKIVFTKGLNPVYDQDANATAKGNFEDGQVIVLINESSASASEIVAGALQDHDRALVVGRRSFGKGLVQNPFLLSDGSEVRLTISRYFTPSGRTIQKPYDGSDLYNEDLENRFHHGELFNSDSIHFNDSLKFQTANGRTVYGGGGIMPDYFVPLDTTDSSLALNAFYNTNTIQEFAFDYAEKNKKAMSDIGLKLFLSDFMISDQMFDALIKLGTKNDISPKIRISTSEKRIFSVHLKANIGRRIWGNDGFYPVINELNEVLLQATGLFDQSSSLLQAKNNH
jgi:carboxyl-terminal processing protease